MSPRLKVANNATTTLNGDVANDATQLTLTSSATFPAAPFRLTVNSEVIEVGAINTTSHVCSSLLRGRESTAAAAHLNGATVTARWTAGTYDELAIDADLTTHTGNTTTAHGAVATATASKLMVRDASARVAVADGAAAGDAVNKGQLDAKEGTVAAGTTLQYWRGDKSWQALLGEAAETAYRGDRGKTAYDHSQAVTGAEHGAVSTATASMIARRDASARLAVADGAAAGDAVNKGQLDAKEATVAAGTTLQYWRGDKSWQTLLGETSATAYRGDRGKDAYDHISAVTGGEHGAVSTNTASTIVARDASARARFADPSDDQDAATKVYVDSLARDRIAVLTAAGGIAAGTNGPAKTQVSGTNHDYFVLAFDKATDESAYFDFVVPPDYTGTNITVKVYWIAPALTTGDVVWNYATLGRTSGEAWDNALGTPGAVTQTTAGTAKQVNVATFAAAASGWAAGDAVIFKIMRDADHASDTLNEDAHFLMAEVRYTGR